MGNVLVKNTKKVFIYLFYKHTKKISYATN